MIKLFEIPIYSWSESEFMKKIEQHKKRFLEKYCERTPIQALEKTYRDFYNNKKQYRDYCIGCLEVRYDRISIHYALNIYWTFKYNRQKEGVRNVRNGRFVPYQTQLYSGQKHYSKSIDISGYHSQFDDYNEISQMVLNDIERIKTDKDYKKLYFDTKHFKEICRCLDMEKYIKSKVKEYNDK